MSLIAGVFYAFIVYAVVYVCIDSLTWEEWSMGKLRAGGYPHNESEVVGESNLSHAAMFMSMDE